LNEPPFSLLSEIIGGGSLRIDNEDSLYGFVSKSTEANQEMVGLPEFVRLSDGCIERLFQPTFIAFSHSQGIDVRQPSRSADLSQREQERNRAVPAVGQEGVGNKPPAVPQSKCPTESLRTS
jgi:hypothetical protein